MGGRNAFGGGRPMGQAGQAMGNAYGGGQPAQNFGRQPGGGGPPRTSSGGGGQLVASPAGGQRFNQGHGAAGPIQRDNDGRTVLKGLYAPRPPKMKYTGFKDTEWEEFSDQCKFEWGKMGISSKEHYDHCKPLICGFCENPFKNHTNGKCPFAWSGSSNGVVRFGELEAAARVMRHSHLRTMERLSQMQGFVGGDDPIPSPLWDSDEVREAFAVMCSEGAYAVLTARLEPEEGETFDDVYDRYGPACQMVAMIAVNNGPNDQEAQQD